ncbi:MAG TPA: AAA family ATPase [Chloroflexota bacterium]|nr:AAA family ATPase [Chloroflexota bacterium]
MDGIDTDVVDSAGALKLALGQYPHWVAVLDASISEEVLPDIRQALRAGSVPTLVLVPPGEAEQVRGDSILGARDECATKPIESDELAVLVKALMIRSGYQPKSDAFRHAASQANGAPGRLIVVAHAKGGVGASTVATNLAVGLARTGQPRTLLVDADLWYGDIGVLMDLKPTATIFRAVDTWTGQEFDEWELRKVPAAHKSGVSVLMRPDDPALVEQLDMALAVKAIARYTTLFDFVVVDTAPSLSELTLDLMDSADEIVLVATSDVSALHNTRRFLDIAERVGYLTKIVLVVNRADTGVSTDLVEQHLHVPAAVSLPSAGRLVVDAANRGMPVLYQDQEPDHQFARDLIRLVEVVAGRTLAPPPPTAKRGIAFWRRGPR